ncbi:OFA family MFS transporter [Streptococcus parauberis]|uniref:OFA family MFS transporter n=2 Tax=Streptococcus parauberis TaxID=1348 RepID=A0A0E2UBG0_9STRE|nr:OFA family MFS transporter [Streptococcus parauberis]AUT06468.1 putative MFS-type transporter [Streptococcus parauberis]EMF50186.1 Major facilitator:Oxalate:Formate Antiporter [Streptococcus parauberis KRS-02109]EMG25521.1 Major facilitator:Oxalate:Formate Antiporter [Streptococcus parauberis KRS-02083]KYP21031.1 putative MFS-type transporter YhjX [Streptococcus parauberis]KYP21415.1 putative MFS-type transporter YhjX [Streptococcus parauberis]
MKKTNRYIVATAGVVLHLMLGSTYAWSVYRNPIMMETGWQQSSVAFAFSLAIFCLGMSAAFMGKLVEKFGPRLTGTISAILYAGGTMLTGLAVANHQLWLLYLGYGVVGGLGLGAGYITPVSTIIKWFPDKRGLATGLAIMGFGFASLLTSPIAQYLINHRGLVNTFYILGLVYFVIMLISSQFIKKPNPEEFQQLVDKSKDKSATDLTNGMSASQALKTKEFYILWLILFINIACGLGLISVVAPMAQDVAGMSVEAAAVVVGLMGIFNGFGRLLWASLSDFIGRPLTFVILFIVNVLMSFFLIIFHIPFLFVLSMAILMTCYGAGFSLIPPYLSDIFGAKELATLHGYILTAWGIAALVGPMLLSMIFEMTKSYTNTLVVFIGLYLLALSISVWLKNSLATDKKESLVEIK